MVQFHIETGWSIRYVAGQNDPGWGAKTVAAEPPATWTVITRDLFADFGQCTVTGIALVAFRGQGAYFDHVYFGQTVDDLDRIDATDLHSHRRRSLMQKSSKSSGRTCHPMTHQKHTSPSGR